MGKKGSGQSENIRVVIRKRPMSDAEKQNCKETVHLDLAMGSVSVHHSIGEPDRWTFDAVYDNTFTQQNIFKAEVLPLVQSVLDGYNSTVFAYGQSGSGKTFTMTGRPGSVHAGMMPHALEAIFEGIKKLESPQKSYRVKVQYLELYNGRAKDLISKGKKPANLEIKNFHVTGSECPEVASMTECMKLFDEGTDRRTTAQTDLNEHSSRSHAIFSVMVISTDHEADAGTPVVMQSKLNLCDLAGSERHSKTNATGDTMKEGCNINLSLSALGTVIDTLVKGKGHVPYRSSPLTMLLKDSLGGNSKTVMFANVGPADMNTSETISTLRFADRAKQIENKPVKNMDPKDQLIQELKAQVDDLKKRLARGGGGDLEAEERLREQMETLELERDGDRQAWERDKLELETEVSTLGARNKQSMEMVEKAQLELQQAVDQKQVNDNLVINLRDELKDLKRTSMDFIQRLLPDDVLNAALKKVPKDDNEDEDGVWGRNKLYSLMDACTEYSKGSQGVSQEEVDRKVELEKVEWEARIKQTQETLDRERAYFQEELAKEKNLRTEDSESNAKIKSELQAKEQEVTRLKEKITRDLEKFKQKLSAKQQDRDDILSKLQNKEEELQEKVRELERLNTQLKEQDANVEGRLSKREVEAKERFEKEMESVKREMEGKLEVIEGEKAQMLAKMNQMEIQNKQSMRKALVQGARGGKDGDAAGDTNDPNNEAFLDEGELAQLGDDSINKDMFEELHIQVRLQCRLQRLRHLQQKQLDGLVERYHKASGDHRGKVSEEKMNMAVKTAVTDKDAEIEKLKGESQRTQDKLVKRINKKLAEFQETEQKLREEQLSLEEENKELMDMNDNVARQHEQALETATTLKSLLEQRDSETENLRRRAARELQQMENKAEHLQEEVDDLKKRVHAGKAIEMNHNDLKKEYELTKVSLRDQRGQVEAQRARLKNMEDMWTEEKSRSEELRAQLEEARHRIEKTEQHYQELVREHGTKMSKLLHEKLEEQQQHYMDELHEQQMQQKQIKEKLKKARNITQKAKQKFDEMVLENERLQTQFEEFKITAFRFHQDSDRLEVDDNMDRIQRAIRGEKDRNQEQAGAFTGGPVRGPSYR
eukprot:TRINITY_DN1768_c1_g3_i1.p1 TRINITY_DN1768_c1_g3~~TRINITY_DN1768_c1_g3_i1.p1  ORF type:complete len:1110 (+),score=579.53 TRINITY_DN1768_c1_g3_i1:108-3437(+)